MPELTEAQARVLRALVKMKAADTRRSTMADNPTVSTANLRGHIARLEAEHAELREMFGRVLNLTPAHVTGERAHKDSYRRRVCREARALLDKEPTDD